jgi:hypothetical protein
MRLIVFRARVRVCFARIHVGHKIFGRLVQSAWVRFERRVQVLSQAIPHRTSPRSSREAHWDLHQNVELDGGATRWMNCIQASQPPPPPIPCVT